MKSPNIWQIQFRLQAGLEGRSKIHS